MGVFPLLPLQDNVGVDVGQNFELFSVVELKAGKSKSGKNGELAIVFGHPTLGFWVI